MGVTVGAGVRATAAERASTNRCLAIDQCISAPYGSQGYHRGDEVIETTGDCALLGWTPCAGDPGEPEECTCTEDAGLTCE